MRKPEMLCTPANCTPDVPTPPEVEHSLVFSTRAPSLARIAICMARVSTVPWRRVLSASCCTLRIAPTRVWHADAGGGGGGDNDDAPADDDDVDADADADDDDDDAADSDNDDAADDDDADDGHCDGDGDRHCRGHAHAH
eukprot:4816611-Pyramimonas_sp.AAC.1